MATQFLRRFFAPRSLVIVGSCSAPDSLGGAVLSNVLAAGFRGPVCSVSPYAPPDSQGVLHYARVEELLETPDLAIVCTPLESVPETLEALGNRGVRAAVVLSGGLALESAHDSGDESDYENSHAPHGENGSGRSLRQRIHWSALRSGMRVLGPECLGIAIPAARLNATYASQPIADGRVAYLGQSGMLGNAMIDWAAGREVGFSHFITLGDSVDVRLPDLIDYLNGESRCRALLLHLEHIRDARHFMTALREASRNRLVLAIQSGRHPQAVLEEIIATPGIERRDQITEAAMARAGVVRVADSDELFDALETLSRFKPPRGEGLAIVSNGVGPALLAIDELMDGGGQLAVLSDATSAALIAAGLDVSRPGRNPIDLGGAATPQAYLEALDIVTQDKAVSVVLVLHAPTRMAPAMDTAQALIEARERYRDRLLVSWMGLKEALGARSTCNHAGIPSYISPEKAVRAFLHLVRYRRVQRLLQETPPSLTFNVDRQARAQAHAWIEETFERGEDRLDHRVTAAVLDAYAIACAPSLYVSDLEEAEMATARLPGPWAVKAIHADNCVPFFDGKNARRQPVSLVQDLEQPGSVVDAVVRLQARLGEALPDASLTGFCLQTMQRGKSSLQLCAGITRDVVFGPIIVFGSGGYKVDVMADRQVALPPLNRRLAQELIDRTRAGRLIREHSVDVDAAISQVAELLVKLSQMAANLPRLKGLEINPLLLNRDGLTAVDFALDLGEPAVQAIMPYPEELRETLDLKGTRVELRPIRGEDAPLITHFHTFLSEQSIRYRYFHHKAVISPPELARLSQINYDRQMAFIAVKSSGIHTVDVTATTHESFQNEEMLGVVRVWNDPDNIRTEFSIIVRDDYHGVGLGRALMEKMIRYSRQTGTLAMVGTILIENQPMKRLLEGLDFTCKVDIADGVIEATCLLNEPLNDWQRLRLEAALKS